MAARYPLFLFLVLLIPLSARAWQGPALVGWSGELTTLSLEAGDETPAACHWKAADAGGNPLDLDQAAFTGEGSPCFHRWRLVGADAGMEVATSWDPDETGATVFKAYAVDLRLRVDLADGSVLTASREVTGNLAESVHTVTVEYPAGSVATLLGQAGGPDEVLLTLPPGSYLVTITVRASEDLAFDGTTIDAYDGLVRLGWSDPETLPLERSRWGTIKSIYR